MASANGKKAVVHVSGSLLRRAWFGNEPTSCIIVRPAGNERDTVAYVVHQAKFTGPSEMIYGAQPRKRGSYKEKGKLADSHGVVGTLPGFDNSVLVYVEADEEHIQVQPRAGDKFVSIAELRKLAKSRGSDIVTVNPMFELNC